MTPEESVAKVPWQNVVLTEEDLDALDALLAGEPTQETGDPPAGQKFFSEDQLRDERGRWTVGGGRAWTGEQVEIHERISKLAVGHIAERAVLDYLRGQGLTDARPLNLHQPNFPVDLVQDHGAIEVKGGLVSNGKSAQQWRATIGEPGKEEKAWLAKASDAAKERHNEKKMQDILDRKEAVRARLEKELGRPVKAWTYGLIINPDKGTADIFRFEGFHLRIPWTKAHDAYLTTVHYKHGR